MTTNPVASNSTNLSLYSSGGQKSHTGVTRVKLPCREVWLLSEVSGEEPISMPLRFLEAARIPRLVAPSSFSKCCFSLSLIISSWLPLTAAGKGSLLLRAHVITSGPPEPPRPLPILRSVTLICKVPSVVSGKMSTGFGNWRVNPCGGHYPSDPRPFCMCRLLYSQCFFTPSAPGQIL